MQTTRHLRLVPDLPVQDSERTDPLEQVSLTRVWLHIMEEIDELSNEVLVRRSEEAER
jgi:hypothetical protein